MPRLKKTPVDTPTESPAELPDDMAQGTSATPNSETADEATPGLVRMFPNALAGEWDEITIEEDADRRHIYSASALGGCEASLVAAAMGRTGEAMPESLQPRLDEGTAMEPIILAMHAEEFGYRAATYPELADLKARGVIAGYNPEMQQIQTIMNIGKTARLRTHPDRIATHQRPDNTKTKTPPTFYVVEAKAFGEALWKKWKKEGIEGFDRYAWQLSAQMVSTGLTGIFVVGRKVGQNDECTIGEIDVTVFEEPPFSVAKVKARILKAEHKVQDEEIPPCKDGTWPCRFFKEAFCLGKPPAEVEVLDDVRLGELARKFYTCSQDMADTDEQKQAKKDRDLVKGEIDKYMANSGVERGKKYVVKSEVGESYEFEWVVRDVEKSAFTMRYPTVKLLGGVK